MSRLAGHQRTGAQLGADRPNEILPQPGDPLLRTEFLYRLGTCVVRLLGCLYLYTMSERRFSAHAASLWPGFLGLSLP